MRLEHRAFWKRHPHEGEDPVPSRMTEYTLHITHYTLHITHYTLHITHCSLLTAHTSLVFGLSLLPTEDNSTKAINCQVSYSSNPKCWTRSCPCKHGRDSRPTHLSSFVFRLSSISEAVLIIVLRVGAACVQLDVRQVSHINRETPTSGRARRRPRKIELPTMQHTLERKLMRNETAFVVIVTRTVRNIPVDGRLERRRNARRMVYVILKQILCDTRTAERITVIQTQGPFQHFVFLHLRRKPAVKLATPVETLRKFVTPVRKFRESDLVRIRIVLVVETVTRIDGKHVVLQNLETERRRNIGEIQRVRRKVVRKAMSCREQSAGPVLVFDHLSLLRRITASRIDMPSHLEVLDIKVVAQAEPNRLLLLLVRRLPQERMRSERLYRINFGRIRVRNARRKHVTNTREPSNFRHPDTVKFRIGGQAVAMIVSDIAKRSFARIKAHVTFSFVQRVIRVPPRCTQQKLARHFGADNWWRLGVLDVLYPEQKRFLPTAGSSGPFRNRSCGPSP